MCVSRSLCFFSTLARPVFSRSRKFIGVCSALLPSLALAHGTFDARLASLSEKLALQPENAVLHFNVAELYCEHEEPAKALDELARVKSLGVGELPWDYLNGMCLRQAGRPEEALAALDRYVAVNPDSSPAHLQRARVHATLGHVAASLEDYRAALRLCSRLEPDLVQESADAFAAQGQDDEAVQVLDAALRKLGPIPSLTLRALELETATKRFTAALARIDVLQKTAPRPEPWMAKRAMVLSQAGRTAEARAAWTALIAHLAALPNLERGSHSMSVLAEQAHRELRSLNTASVSPASTSAPAASPRPTSTYLSPPDNLPPARHS